MKSISCDIGISIRVNIVNNLQNYTFDINKEDKYMAGSIWNKFFNNTWRIIYDNLFENIQNIIWNNKKNLRK